ncbi:DoxX family membrane protein [Xylophilus rhododendri]|uniref:DoxX family membrane protein n=1 Tax=Xylophilus rhododendri TaxID=2697032 RepID=A0A857JE74_9BURK|nr:DoxX family protein [Xylophilus rhododendri]QHJ01079.1 DoxX family membrane protein [Xylophilus rhododendri]
MPRATGSWLQRGGLLLLCSAYLQGGLMKAFDFGGAVAELQHFGMAPAVPLALATIVLEIVAPVMIVAGYGRWLAALGLAGFTLVATFLANRFWEVAGPERFMLENAFFEHLGLVGAFLLVALWDFSARRPAADRGLASKT